jgi:AcrR family transcriptional regulator
MTELSLRRRLEPEARRAEILDAAWRVLRRDGAGARVEDIVREAGAAKGTFYLYFPSWDDLLEAVRERIFAEFDARYPMPTEVAGPIDWLVVIDWLAGAFVDFTLELGGVHAAVFHSDFAQRRPPPALDNAATRVAAIIRAAQEAGQFDADIDPEPTARLLFAALHEGADAIEAGDDRAAVLAAVRRLLRRTLQP